MLRALAAFETRPPTRQAAAPPAEGAERRQLTVMFCDLVGSTALSARPFGHRSPCTEIRQRGAAHLREPPDNQRERQAQQQHQPSEDKEALAYPIPVGNPAHQR